MVRVRALDPPSADPGILTVSGHQLLVDGAPHPPMNGFRVASASQSEAYTQELIDALPSYAAAGVNASTVFLQGSSGGHSQCFTDDGTGWSDPAHPDRVHRIADAMHALNMTLFLGLYYQNADPLASSLAYLEAAALAAGEFAEHPRLIFNLANENNSWSGAPYPMENANALNSMAPAITDVDPDRLVGAGGYGRSANGDYSTTTVPLFTAANIDLLLFDTFSQGTCGFYFDDHMANGLNDGTGKARKPAVNVETFGGSTKAIHPTQGVYTPEWFGLYQQDIDEALARYGQGLMGTLMHDNRWFQGVSIDSGDTGPSPSPALPWDNRYDLAGQGTTGDPGVAWWPAYFQSQA